MRNKDVKIIHDCLINCRNSASLRFAFHSNSRPTKNVTIPYQNNGLLLSYNDLYIETILVYAMTDHAQSMVVDYMRFVYIISERFFRQIWAEIVSKKIVAGCV